MRGGARGRGYGGRPPRSQMNIPRQLQPQPEIAGHLQGLKDIDMELELLKRKREIIEQQQHILSNSYRPRNNYGPVNQSQDNRYDDYTRLYNNPRESGQFGGPRGIAQSRKRSHNIPVWDTGVPPKRFSGPTRGAKAPGSRANSRPAFNQAPEPHFPAPKPFRRPPPPQKKKEFNPTKVTKPSTVPPLKLASYQPAERKKLVAEALASSGPADAALDTFHADAWTLRADVEPSRKIIGRLELGLGDIMKELKNSNPQYEASFRSPSALRVMKQVVRDRIRTAMIGKQVIGIEAIKAAYYDMFPKTNDTFVVMKGLACQDNKSFLVVDTDKPETYFKRNIQVLMSQKMEEMINKLYEIYSSGTDPYNERYKGQKNKKVYKDYEQNSKNTKAEDEPAPVTNENDTANKDNVQTKSEGEASNEKVESAAETSETNEIKGEASLETDENDTQKNDDSNQPKPESEPVDTPLPGDPETDETPKTVDEQATTEVDSKNTETKLQRITREKSLELINTDEYLALDKLMTYKMLHLLKRYTPDFVKLMDVNKMYRETKAAIIQEMKQKMVNGRANNTPNGAGNGETAEPGTSLDGTPQKPRFTSLLHYVKILGKPALPKRRVMQNFFKEFQPKSIKKHKTIHNLLFVGFLDKESFDKILAADGTTMGRITLDIKVSERADTKKPPPIENKPNDPTDIIGTALDNQITDLLLSIRKSEEMENFAEDVVMADPPTAEPEALTENVSKTENGEETAKIDPDIVDCDADENKAADNSVDNDVIELKDGQQDDDVVEIKDVVKEDAGEEVKDNASKDDKTIVLDDDEEKKDAVAALITEVKDVKGTPTRSSARLATPGGIKTRRMSKFVE